MNTLSVKQIQIPSGGKNEVFLVDDKPLYEIVEERIKDNKEITKNYPNLFPIDDLAICFTDDFDFEGDSRFMKYVLGMEKAITPILSCPEDMDFSCTVLVADVIKTKDKVCWKRIGIVNHDNEISSEDEKIYGISYHEAYTDEDWKKYGDNIALEEVGSDAWYDFICANYGEEIYRRRKNYTFPYYQDEKNIDWLANLNFEFDRKQYEELIKECYKEK